MRSLFHIICNFLFIERVIDKTEKCLICASCKVGVNMATTNVKIAWRLCRPPPIQNLVEIRTVYSR